MDWQIIFPIFTTTVSFLFFVSVTEQYFRKRKPQQLFWSISMFLFCITAGAEAVSLIVGNWNTMVYRTYYLLAAIQVSLMGAGLLYLFTRRNVIHGRNAAKAVLIFWGIWLLFSSMYISRDPIFYWVYYPSIILILLSLVYVVIDFIDRKRNTSVTICSSCKKEMEEKCKECEWGKLIESYQSSSFNRFWQKIFQNDNFAHLFVINILFIFVLMNFFVWTSPLEESLLRTGKEVSGIPWQPQGLVDGPRAVIRLFSPLNTVPGAIALIGGGIYSYVSWQRAIKRNTGKYDLQKGVFNLYIAIGAYVLGIGGTLSGYQLGTLYISEVISVAFMYFGFLESDKITYNVLRNLFSFKFKKIGTQISSN
ncbi:MAG: hypothetical protein INQ03_03260 [Candidatus Heimdallarchaeota archaeon]|nr:hypothetical protein [Candidatus Heimdallarchaeota archaeon]